jgi:hypothetical protein
MKVAEEDGTWRQAEDGTWQQRGADGYWHPSEASPTPSSRPALVTPPATAVPAKRSRVRRNAAVGVIGVALVAGLAVGLVLGLRSGTSHTQSWRDGYHYGYHDWLTTRTLTTRATFERGCTLAASSSGPRYGTNGGETVTMWISGCVTGALAEIAAVSHPGGTKTP